MGTQQEKKLRLNRAIGVNARIAHVLGWTRSVHCLRAPPVVSPTRPSAGVFSSGRRYSAQPHPRFLISPRNRPLIHPKSPGHTRPPGCARGLRTREKWGQAHYVGERTREPHFLIANPPSPLIALSPSVACTPPSLLPPAYIPLSDEG
jgi:hypothetical protein